MYSSEHYFPLSVLMFPNYCIKLITNELILYDTHFKLDNSVHISGSNYYEH